MIEPIVHETFSPTILEFQVPDKFVDMVNLVGDAVLGDDKLSKQWDFSDNLVEFFKSHEVKEKKNYEHLIRGLSAKWITHNAFIIKKIKENNK